MGVICYRNFECSGATLFVQNLAAITLFVQNLAAIDFKINSSSNVNLYAKKSIQMISFDSANKCDNISQ
jgi:hypothetical protein